MNLVRLNRGGGKTHLIVSYVLGSIERGRPAVLVVHCDAEAQRLMKEYPKLRGFVYAFHTLMDDPIKRSAIRDGHVEVYMDNADLIMSELFGKAPHIMTTTQ